jgi:predicted RNA polymerase sigma factor
MEIIGHGELCMTQFCLPLALRILCITFLAFIALDACPGDELPKPPQAKTDGTVTDYFGTKVACAKLRRTAEARQNYQKFLELAPNSKSAPEVRAKMAAITP